MLVPIMGHLTSLFTQSCVIKMSFKQLLSSGEQGGIMVEGGGLTPEGVGSIPTSRSPKKKMYGLSTWLRVIHMR